MANMLFIEDAQVIFKNFSGREGDYNAEGVRSFSVVIDDPELAEKLNEDGWNVKKLKKEFDEDPDRYQLPVAVSYKYIPPRIEMLMGGNRVTLTEENVGELDNETIVSADVYIAPSSYVSRITGEERVKAYLRSMMANIELDPIAQKYSNFGKE